MLGLPLFIWVPVGFLAVASIGIIMIVVWAVKDRPPK